MIHDYRSESEGYRILTEPNMGATSRGPVFSSAKSIHWGIKDLYNAWWIHYHE